MTSQTMNLCELFAESVKRNPQAIAVDHEEACLTYSQLDVASTAVATNIQTLGATAGSTVVLVSEHGTLNVVAMLGILKTGSSFVPIDQRAWSENKISHVLDTVDCNVIVKTTQDHLLLRTSHNVLRLRSLSECGQLQEPLKRPNIKPEDIACVVFTSGSTGKPKGVVLTHDAISLYARTSPFNMDVCPGDSVLHMLSIGFDAYICIVFSTLGNGGTVLPAQPEDVHEKLKRCSIIAATPSLLASLPRPPSDGDVTAIYPLLHTILLGGETATDSLLDSWLNTPARILNGYGPCETTCTGTIQLVERDKNGRVQAAIVGQPMDPTPIYLVDEKLNIIEDDGVEGEILIGGRSLAKGYYNDELKTSQSFIEWKGTRIYRTGDFGRWTQDCRNGKALEFRGRRDRTVKNRGFLINLEADVEAPIQKLGSSFGIQEVHAAMFKGRLIAAVRPECTHLSGLMCMIRTQLCAYQIPSQIETLRDFPLSANGKVEPAKIIRVFEELEAARVQDLQSSAVSANIEENCENFHIVMTCVAEALGLSSTVLGPDENFFKLGGQSLAALQAVSLCRARGLCITMADIYTFTTIGALAAHAVVLDSNVRRSAHPEIESSQANLKAQVKEYLDLEDQKFEVSHMTQLQLQLALPTLKYDGLNTNQLHLTYSAEDAMTAEDAWVQLWHLEPIFRTELILHLGGGVEVIRRQPISQPNRAVYCDREQYTQAIGEVTFAVGLGSSLNFLKYLPPSKSPDIENPDVESLTVILTIHHSLIDGHSLRLLLQKATSIAQGVLPIQSPSFSQGKLDLKAVQKEGAENAKAFWQDYLKTTVERDTKASVISAHDDLVALAKEQRFDYYEKIESMKQLASNCGVTRAAVYYTAWASALSNHPENDTVLVGAVFSGRESLLSQQDTIGVFISTLPLVVELNDELSVVEQLQNTMKGLSLISQYTWTRPDQIPTKPNNLLAIQPCISFPNQTPKPLKAVTYENSAFPFGLLVDDEDGQFRLMYNPKVISDVKAALTIGKFIAHLDSLLRRGSSTPKTVNVKEFSLPDLSISPNQRTVATAFEDSVRSHAQLDAIEDATKVMTYAALNANAEKVASKIRCLAPSAKTVSIYGDGTMNWCIGLLGALKAGCAYCPLDPNWSPEFKASIFERSCSDLLVVSSSDQRNVLSLDSIKVIAVDEAVQHDDTLTSAHSLKPRVSPDNNFLIVFTSGSTGVPKGVPVSHRAFLAIQSYPEATMFSCPGRRIAQFMSPAFDYCAHEIFSALLHGGTLVLKDADDPYGHLSRVDAATITPSVMGVLDPDKYPNLSFVYSTGESVTPALVDLFGPGRQFYNAYGPAEACICASFTKLAPGDAVTIGHGLPTARMYLLNSDLQAASEGEIFIAGEQVMHGYIGSTSETAKCIRTDPWHQGDRMYRTGDYGRLTDDGAIEYIGRLDRMVKFRGFRVELPGIEQMIYKLDSRVVLAAALVVASKLVAFVKPSLVDPETLQMSLAKNLPSAWVPDHILPLDEIPTTANMKTDFKALEKLMTHEQLCKGVRRISLPLQNQQEEQVAHEWRQILKLDSNVPLSANDHFLELGGHSVLQILLAERLSQISGVKISVRQVIQAPILRDQASLLPIFVAPHEIMDKNILPLPRTTAVSEGGLSELEQEVWFQHQIATNVTTFNIGIILHIHGTFERERLLAAFNEVLSSQAILRSNFFEQDQGPWRKLRENPPHIREANCLDYDLIVNTPFDLAKDELIRTFLVNGQTVFICTTHAIADLNSVQSLLRLISCAYAHPTLAVPSSTLDCYMNSEVWNEQVTEVEKSFWKDYLCDAPRSLKLARNPTDKKFEGQSQLRCFNQSLVSRLEQRMRQLGVTKHQLALAALAQALYWLTGQSDVVLGAPLENRPTRVDRDSVGLFLAKIPVRLQKEQLHPRNASDPVSGLLRAAQYSSQQAVAHAIPFSELLDLLGEGPTVTNTRHPIFECVVTFHLREAVANCLIIPGCTVTSGPPCFGRGSKFLLMCEWTENADKTWTLRIEYDSYRISSAVIKAIEQCIEVTLGAFADDCTYADLRSRAKQIEIPDLTPWKPEQISALISHEMNSISKTKTIASCSDSFFIAGVDPVAALKLRRRLLQHGIDVSLPMIMGLKTPQQLSEYLCLHL